MRTTLPGELAVVTCYFNPCGYRRPRENYDRFAAGMARHGVDLYTSELAFGDAPFALPASERTFRFRTETVLWPKERLLNLAIARLPARYDKVGWFDADVLFRNPGWVAETARRLEDVPVVQPFEVARCTDADGRLTPRRKRAITANLIAGRPDAWELGRSHPGFAWAARRSLLDRHGLWDKDIVGGADTAMVIAMAGRWDQPYLKTYNPAWREALLRWAAPFHEEVGGRVGSVPGEVVHLWHGATAHRQYWERTVLLRRRGYDPDRMIAPDDQGVWRWTDRADPEIVAYLKDYFLGRREDG